MTPDQAKLAARVVVGGVPKVLSYALQKGQTQASVGSQVVVDVGSRQAKGWLVEKVPLDEALEELKPPAAKRPQASAMQLGLSIDSDSDHTKNLKHRRLKPVLEISPGFDSKQLPLFRWMASYYGYPLADILDAAIPKRSAGRIQQFAMLTEEARTRALTDEQWLLALTKKAPLQAKVIESLLQTPLPVMVSELTNLGSSARSSLQALEKQGLVEILKQSRLEHVLLQQQATHAMTPEEVSLTAPQKNAVEAINSAVSEKDFSPFLLYGVTGSGKTEVYIRSIEHALSTGGSALVIVPEISLTPQLLDRFQCRLNEPIALLHSQVGESARWTAWEALLRGDVRVVIGARSAIFAPLQNLSLIIVDEEHESSYKQSDGLRYHGRDVAVMRAKFANCSIVLGSATPSFESLLNVKKKRYTLLEMPDRATTRPLPSIQVVDLSKIPRREMISENLSPPLHAAITRTLKQKGQVIILYNRRGFSSYLQCETCGEVVYCPECSVTMTYHRGRHKLICHYCDGTFSPPSFCNSCRDPKTTHVELTQSGETLATEKQLETLGKLSYRGSGTEQIIDELHQLFPASTILRMDRDTTSRKDSYRHILGSMRRGEADILVGTQMIAKGHDLPGVSLVGIIDADIGLHLPDFRSSEKVFQLITQAAGRAGRGDRMGEVFVQTREPNHPTIVATATGRYKAFARFEMDQRKNLGYPPWGRLLRVVISHPDLHDAARAAKVSAAIIQELIQLKIDLARAQATETSSPLLISLLGPAPGAHERLRNRYRWHMLVKSNSARSLSELAAELNNWKRSVKHLGDFRLTTDIDPVDML